MPRAKPRGERAHALDEEVIFVRKVPSKGAAGVRWLDKLQLLLKHPGRWARVATYDDPEGAQNAQTNLTQRRVQIPKPDHLWVFSARGCDLYAIYEGPKRTKGQKR